MIIALLFSCTQEESPPKDQPLDELVQLEQLLENPQKGQQICKKTTYTSVLEQCKKLKNRPHLYDNQRSKKGAKNRLPTTYRSPLNDVEPNHNGCLKETYQCHLRAAKIARSQENRAAECLAISNETWRAECFFEVAEEGLKQKKLSYTDAADLCTLTNRFVYNCLQHLSVILAEQQKTLSEYVQGGQYISDFWSVRDDQVLHKMEAIYWSTSMEMYYSLQHTINHTPFLLFPKQAHPHIWSGISRKIVQFSQKQKSLAEWTTDLKQMHQGEKTLQFSKKRPPKDHRRPQFPKNKISPHRKVIYVEEHTRILGETIEEEIQISLLYSAALYRKFPYWKEEAKNIDSPRIQDTIKN